jgi:hypothetical protein
MWGDVKWLGLIFISQKNATFLYYFIANSIGLYIIRQRLSHPILIFCLTFPPRKFFSDIEDSIMQVTLLWDDSTAFRTVKFLVDYSIEGETLSIFDVNPIEVSLLDFECQTVVTRSKIRSERFGGLLRSRFLDSAQLPVLLQKIAAKHRVLLAAS